MTGKAKAAVSTAGCPALLSAERIARLDLDELRAYALGVTERCKRAEKSLDTALEANVRSTGQILDAVYGGGGGRAAGEVISFLEMLRDNPSEKHPLLRRKVIGDLLERPEKIAAWLRKWLRLSWKAFLENDSLRKNTFSKKSEKLGAGSGAEPRGGPGPDPEPDELPPVQDRPKVSELSELEKAQRRVEELESRLNKMTLEMNKRSAAALDQFKMSVRLDAGIGKIAQDLEQARAEAERLKKDPKAAVRPKPKPPKGKGKPKAPPKAGAAENQDRKPRQGGRPRAKADPEGGFRAAAVIAGRGTVECTLYPRERLMILDTGEKIRLGDQAACFWIKGKLSLKEITDQAVTMQQTNFCAAVKLRDSAGEEYTVCAATYPDVSRSKTGPEPSRVRPPDTPAARLCAPFGFSGELISQLAVSPLHSDQILYHPLRFDGYIAEVSTARPLYAKSRNGALSERSVAELLVAVAAAQVPMNRLKLLAEAFGGHSFRSSGAFADMMNSAVRAYFIHPWEVTRRCVMERNSVLHADETQVTVDEHRRASGQATSWLWLFRSPDESEFPGAVWHTDPSRGAEVPLKLLGVDPGGGKQEFRSKLRTLICDGCASYDSAVNTIEELTGVTVRTGRCWSHARRYLLEALDNYGRRKLFEQLFKSGGYEGFNETFDAWREEHPDDDLGEAEIRLMHILLYIARLFEDEKIIWTWPDDDIVKLRKEYSLPLIEKVFAEIRALRDCTGCVEQRGGIWRQKGESLCGKALVYALNHEDDLKVYLKVPAARPDNNLAENSIRLKSYLANVRILRTGKGALSYSAVTGIVETCRMNGVDPERYMLWIIACVKFRLETMRLRNKNKSQICFRPKPFSYKGEDGQRHRIDLYDPEFSTVFDDIVTDDLGLDTYLALCGRKRS